MWNATQYYSKTFAGFIAVQNHKQTVRHFQGEKTAAHGNKTAERCLKRNSPHHDGIWTLVEFVHNKAN